MVTTLAGGCSQTRLHQKRQKTYRHNNQYSGEMVIHMSQAWDCLQWMHQCRSLTPLEYAWNPTRQDDMKTPQLWQQNVNKSLLSQLNLLRSLWWDKYNICAVQEPYIDFNSKSQANRQWITLYLSTHGTHPQSSRSLILINTNLLTDSWKQITFQHPDIMAIEITGASGMLCIINIYNDCKNNGVLMHVSAYMWDRERQRYTIGPLHTIWLGDFNQHHQLWDKARNAHLFTTANIELVQLLLNMLGRHNMKMALPPFIPTLWSHSMGNHMRVNNIFCSTVLVDAIVKCNMDDTSQPVKMDHYPIVTQLNIHAPKVVQRPRYNSDSQTCQNW